MQSKIGCLEGFKEETLELGGISTIKRLPFLKSMLFETSFILDADRHLFVFSKILNGEKYSDLAKSYRYIATEFAVRSKLNLFRLYYDSVDNLFFVYDFTPCDGALSLVKTDAKPRKLEMYK